MFMREILLKKAKELMNEIQARKAKEQSEKTGQKRYYCSRCGLRLRGLVVLWMDEAGRLFRYDRHCARRAERDRADFVEQKGQGRG